MPYPILLGGLVVLFCRLFLTREYTNSLDLNCVLIVCFFNVHISYLCTFGVIYLCTWCIVFRSPLVHVRCTLYDSFLYRIANSDPSGFSGRETIKWGRMSRGHLGGCPIFLSAQSAPEGAQDLLVFREHSGRPTNASYYLSRKS